MLLATPPFALGDPSSPTSLGEAATTTLLPPLGILVAARETGLVSPTEAVPCPRLLPRITAVVIALDNERMTTGSVRALKRLYPEMPIFVRATDEKHRRKLASAGATALETGPQESALLLGGALLSSMGMPAEEVWP